MVFAKNYLGVFVWIFVLSMVSTSDLMNLYSTFFMTNYLSDYINYTFNSVSNYRYYIERRYFVAFLLVR